MTCFALIEMKWLTGWREKKKESQLSVYRQVLRRLSAIFTLLHFFAGCLMQLHFKFNTINTQPCDVINTQNCGIYIIIFNPINCIIHKILISLLNI